jgi:hypothetical protein
MAPFPTTGISEITRLAGLDQDDGGVRTGAKNAEVSTHLVPMGGESEDPGHKKRPRYRGLSL